MLALRDADAAGAARALALGRTAGVVRRARGRARGRVLRGRWPRPVLATRAPRVIEGIAVLAELFEPGDLRRRRTGRGVDAAGADGHRGQAPLRPIRCEPADRRADALPTTLRLPLVRPRLGGPLRRRPRGLGRALPRLPGQGRRQRLPAWPPANARCASERPRRVQPRLPPEQPAGATTTGTCGGAASREGPLHDGPWAMELDEVTRWLDDVPMGGSSSSWAAGIGLVVGAARREGRAVALRRRRRLARRGPQAPDGATACWRICTSAIRWPRRTSRRRRLRRLSARRRRGPGRRWTRASRRAAWLKPGGTFVFIEAGATCAAGADAHRWHRPVRCGHGARSVLRAAAASGGGLRARSRVGGTRSAFVLGSGSRRRPRLERP